MILDIKVLHLLKYHEGFVAVPTPCPTGHMTIGYGHNLDAHPIDDTLARIKGWDAHWKTTGITEKQASTLLEDDLEKVVHQLRTHVPVFTNLDSVRQAVLLDMAFNLGISGLLKFTQTLNSIKQRSFLGAAICMGDSKWARQVKIRAHRLCDMMATGQWPTL